jgi:aminoglycoside 6'-N-acetyltransferase I
MTPTVKVRPVTEADQPAWLALRRQLWPESSGAHARDITRFFAGESRNPLAVMLAEDDHARGQGVGRALINACEAWARLQGCSEFASDAETDNAAGFAAHLALGFADEGVVRCFSKKL